MGRSLFLLAIAFLLFGCDIRTENEKKIAEANAEATIRSIKRHEDEAEKSGQNCLKRGGVIVRSAWDGRILECK